MIQIIVFAMAIVILFLSCYKWKPPRDMNIDCYRTEYDFEECEKK